MKLLSEKFRIYLNNNNNNQFQTNKYIEEPQ